MLALERSRVTARARLLSFGVALVVTVALLQNGCRRRDDAPYGKDKDGDGWPSDFDCDDDDDDVFPNADEIPGDGIDQDCSGSDELGLGGEGGQSNEPCEENCGSGGDGGGTSTGDGIGRDEDRDGYTEASGDCDDEDPFVHPGAFDAPADGLDQDCDGLDSADSDGDGVDGYPDGEDCDDTRGEVFPGALEIVLNGIDENCDGSDLVGAEESSTILSPEAVLGAPPDICVVELDGEPYLMAVWADSRVAARQDVYAQLLTLDGEAVGPEMPVATDSAGAKAGVRVASTGDAVLVVWASAEGVFAQQLSAEGEQWGIPLGIADPGALDPQPTVGAWDHNEGPSWAIVWRRPEDDPGTQAQLRMVSIETEAVRAPIVNLGDAQAEIGAAAVTGTPDGFVAAWSAAQSGEAALWTQEYTRTGGVSGDARSIFGDGSPSLALASTEESVVVSFRTGGSFGYAAALFLDLHGQVTAEQQAQRLSSESLYQTNFRMTHGDRGFVSAWADERHMSHVPSVQAVYGTRPFGLDGQDPISGALYAHASVELGGVAAVDDLVFLAVKSDGVARLLVTH